MPPRKGVPNVRGRARREQILDAAIELFARQGYRGTGLLGLAEVVGISHVGILHHFGTKEDLLRSVMERRDESINRLMGEFEGKGIFGLATLDLDESPVLTRLATVLRAENLNPGDPLHDYFDEIDRRTRAAIAAEIRRSQQRREVRAGIDPEVKASEILAFAIGLETQWLLSPDRVDKRETGQSFLRALIHDLTRSEMPRPSRAKRPASTKSNRTEESA